MSKDDAPVKQPGKVVAVCPVHGELTAPLLKDGLGILSANRTRLAHNGAMHPGEITLFLRPPTKEERDRGLKHGHDPRGANLGPAFLQHVDPQPAKPSDLR